MLWGCRRWGAGYPSKPSCSWARSAGRQPARRMSEGGVLPATAPVCCSRKPGVALEGRLSGLVRRSRHEARATRVVCCRSRGAERVCQAVSAGGAFSCPASERPGDGLGRPHVARHDLCGCSLATSVRHPIRFNAPASHTMKTHSTTLPVRRCVPHPALPLGRRATLVAPGGLAIRTRPQRPAVRVIAPDRDVVRAGDGGVLLADQGSWRALAAALARSLDRGWVLHRRGPVAAGRAASAAGPQGRITGAQPAMSWLSKSPTISELV